MKAVNRIFFVLLMLFLSQPLAYAHKISLFCWFEAGKICGEGYFSDGSAVKNSPVQIYNLQGELLKQASTDKEGKFCLTLDKKQPLKIVLSAFGGHRAEFFLAGPKHKQDSFHRTEGNSTFDSSLAQKIEALESRVQRLEKIVSRPTLSKIASGLGWIFLILYFLPRALRYIFRNQGFAKGKNAP